MVRCPPPLAAPRLWRPAGGSAVYADCAGGLTPSFSMPASLARGRGFRLRGLLRRRRPSCRRPPSCRRKLSSPRRPPSLVVGQISVRRSADLAGAFAVAAGAGAAGAGAFAGAAGAVAAGAGAFGRCGRGRCSGGRRLCRCGRGRCSGGRRLCRCGRVQGAGCRGAGWVPAEVRRPRRGRLFRWLRRRGLGAFDRFDRTLGRRDAGQRSRACRACVGIAAFVLARQLLFRQSPMRFGAAVRPAFPLPDSLAR